MKGITNINIEKITKPSMEESEIRYRRLFEAAQDGILILDAKTGMIEDVNPFLIKMLGYSREEFIKRKLWEVGAFKDIEASQDAFESLQENEYIRYENLPLKAKDGRLIQVEFVSNVYMVGSEKVIQCNIRDITARKMAEDGLRKSEESYLNVLENMKEGFQIIDFDWRYYFVNKSVADQAKRKKEELLGHTMMECYPGIEKTDMFAALMRCMDARMPQTIVNEFKYPDGSKRWFELSIQPSVDGIFILSSDINERKLADETLQKSEKRFRELVAHSLEDISLVDSNGILTYESPTSRLPLGYPPNSLVGHNLLDLVHPDELEAATQMLNETIKHPDSVKQAAFRLRHQDGSWHWMEGSLTNLLDEPAVQSVVINYRDVTERKQAEESLRESEIRFRSLYENTTIGLYRTTLDGQILMANPAVLRMLGYKSFEELSQRDLAAGGYEPEYPRQEFQKRMEQDGDVRDLESAWKRKDGSIIYIRESAHITRNENNQPLYYEGTVEDITKRKQAEQEIVNIAKFPSENPNPVLRLSRDGIVMFANKASSSLLNMWGCVVGGTAPQFWCDMAAQRLANKENKTVDIECDGKVYAIFVTPIPESDYVNLYGRDVTERKQNEEEIINSNNELSMLFNLSQSLAEADNLDDILNLVNRHAVESVHTTFARIALLEGENFIMRAGYPLRPLEQDLRLGERNLAAALPYVQRILEQNKPMILRASDSGISNEEKKALLLDFAQALCIIPLRISDSSLPSEKLMGLLMLGEARNEGREPFTPEKMRLAQTIGSSAAIAIRRMLLREQTERRLHQLVALSEIDLAIISSSDMVISLGILLLQAMEQLKVDAVDVWLFNSNSQTLEFVSGRGFQTTVFTNEKQLRLGEGIAGRAALERRTIYIPNLGAYGENPRLEKALKIEPFISYYAVPLIVKNQLKGVLEIFHRTDLESNEDWLNFLHALSNQAAIAIDNSSLFNDLMESNAELTQAYDSTIHGWSRALDLRDNETEGHTQRVTELTTTLGRQFGLSEEELIHVRRGALLHDIGKMGVPDGILLKPGPLTDEEWVVMRKHTTYAYELLSPIDFLRPAIDIPYCHHEKWDGTGYPRGLKGDQIPFAARIFAVVDVWDALTSDRPYRAAWPEEKTLDHIRSLSGTHFDPQIVKICLDSGLLQSHPKMSRGIELFQWTENYSVGVRELDQQHQQLFTLVNRLISATGTMNIHSETISDILGEMTRYAQTHFTTEERLMEVYGYPGLEEQKEQHNDFRNKTTEFIEAATIEGEQKPEVLLKFLTNWLSHHILEDDMAYRSFFNEKGVA
ncbi:MAG TPA: hypothetical protein DIW44_16740 [Anaerolineaceae bacterium]|nr:hypothetical protein [Anaerolineaceae bacterium]